MIKILGTLKGIQLKSKVADDNRAVHTVTLTLELIQGENEFQAISKSLKQAVELQITNRQPSLDE